MNKPLPDKVGGIKVERSHRSFMNEESIESVPRKAVMHDTEGSFESAHSKFLNIDAPNVLAGRDASGKIRIVEYAGIGVMGRALAHPAGTPETNRAAVFQIEIAGFRRVGRELLLSPHKKVMDPEFRQVLAAIMEQVKLKGGVPLVRGGNGTRSATRWASKPGWFGHVEVPSNDHTDPGGHNYEKTFNMVQPWRIVEAGNAKNVLARGTLDDLRHWQADHEPKIRKLKGFNLRPN